MSQEKKKPVDGGRTQYFDRRLKDGPVRKAMMGVSRFMDRLGYRQDKEYLGKTDEEISKKRAGGKVKSLGVKPTKRTPAKMLDRATKAPGKLGARSRMPKALRGME